MTRAVASKLAAATALAGLLLVPEPASAQFTYEVLHNFPAQPAFPEARLVQGTDGVFYGTTIGSPSLYRGAPRGATASTVFALRPKSGGGFNLTVLHEFDPAHGLPVESPIQARDGDLYGTTGGGFDSFLYKVSPTGVFTTLHVLPSDGSNGGIVQATDGSFYVTTSNTVFRMTADGTLTTLYMFGEEGGPNGPLVEGADGAFYGTTRSGMIFFMTGTIFRITPDGTFTRLYTFDTGETPLTGLVRGSDGSFYGTTDIGFPIPDSSKAFKITPSGSFTLLHTFTQSEGVGSWESALIQASDGNFYGTMASSTAYKMTPTGDVTAHPSQGIKGLMQAQDGLLYGVISHGGPAGRGAVQSWNTTTDVFTTVYSIPPGPEPCGPWGGLIRSSDGSFYGTTVGGGTASKGAIFKMTGDGTVTTLHSFTGPDGAVPYAGLLRASDGNFYGTTYRGGSANKGTVFRMTPAGVLTTLIGFSGSRGEFPWAPLIQASDGHLYGTTQSGGEFGPIPPFPLPAYGTIFRVTLSGGFQSLYAFDAHPLEASYPIGPLVQARDGSLYGTTYGHTVGGSSGGSVFRLTLGGIVVLSAAVTDDRITAGLTEGSDGNLYSTSIGAGGLIPGESLPLGSIFKITPEGVKTVIHTFDVDWTEGIRPFNAPIEASDGNFYGTTHRYAGFAGGSIYRFTPTGDFTTLKIMTDVEGAYPGAKLFQASDGKIYGVALSGGTGGCGLIFRFTIP